MPPSNPPDPRGQYWGRQARKKSTPADKKNWVAISQTLRKHGYNVPVATVKTAQVQSALQDFYTHPQANRRSLVTTKLGGQWNSSNARTTALSADRATFKGSTPGMDKVFPKSGNEGVTRADQNKPPKALGTKPRGVLPKKTGGGGGGGAGYGSDAGGMFTIPGVGNPDTFNPISVKNAKMGAQLTPLGYADSLAGYEFDPDIHETRTQMGYVAPDRAQHLADIAAWYGQAGGEFKKGRQQILDTTNALTADSNAATKGLLASLGGEAFGGAGALAGQGDQNTSTLAGLGGNNADYMSQMAALVAGEGADAKTSEARRMDNIYRDQESHLQELLGQRGQAKANAEFGIRGQNNEILDNRANKRLSILQYNRGGKQQNFQNELAAQQNAIAAMMSGQQYQIQAAAARQASGKQNWSTMQPKDRAGLVGTIKQALLDPRTGTPLPLNVKDMWKVVNKSTAGMKIPRNVLDGIVLAVIAMKHAAPAAP